MIAIYAVSRHHKKPRGWIGCKPFPINYCDVVNQMLFKDQLSKQYPHTQFIWKALPKNIVVFVMQQAIKFKFIYT